MVKIIFKTGLFIFVYGFIVYKLTDKMTGFSFPAVFSPLFAAPGLTFVLLPVLWGGNILLESLKWRVLMQRHLALSWRKSLVSVFHGFAFGMFTPYRLGEWIGRVITFKKGRKTGILLAMYGSVLQNLIIGLTGTLFVLVVVHDRLDVRRQFAVYAWLVPVAILMVYVLFRSRLPSYLERFRVLVTSCSQEWYLKTTVLTFLRYMVFSLQLAVLLMIFTAIPISELLLTIPVYFLLITFIPSFSLVDPGVRLLSGFMLFAPQHEWTVEVSMAVLVLWLGNVLIPAGIGSAILMKQPIWALSKIKTMALWKYNLKT